MRGGTCCLLTGAIAPGTRLDLNALTAEFGTSRTPVREALRTPVREALLELSYRPATDR